MASKKKSKSTKKAAKKVVVNRSFLLKLADNIYNPKTKSFLRLCDGTLQNGPDPTDNTRPMHCGLGELYYAMTGLQPEFAGVDEDGVVDLAVDLSTIAVKRKEAFAREEERLEKAADVVVRLNLPEDVKSSLLDVLNDAQPDEDDFLGDPVEVKFREILDDIPTANDDGCGDHGDGGSCTIAEYRKRSQRVAKKLREAARVLPR